jgi:hypothetical protein
VLADGVVTGSFEQSVFHQGEEPPELPSVEEIGSTAWYEQLKVPVVECSFTVREATTIEVADDYADYPIFWIKWVEAMRRLVFDHDVVVVTCARPNLEITATDRVVRYERLRRWRIGGLETGGEWKDD